MSESAQEEGSYLGGVHDDRGHKVEEDVVTVRADRGVVEGYLQLVHGLQQEALCLVVKVLERSLLRRCARYGGRGWSEIQASYQCDWPSVGYRVTAVGMDGVIQVGTASPPERPIRRLTLVTRSEWRMIARTKKR